MPDQQVTRAAELVPLSYAELELIEKALSGMPATEETVALYEKVSEELNGRTFDRL